MSDPKPHEWTYQTYRQNVVLYGDEALARVREDRDRDLHTAVSKAIKGTEPVDKYGYTLMAVYWSDQSPESPDYCEPWQTYTDFKANEPEGKPTAQECIRAMAYVCVYSDVMDYCKRQQDRPDVDGDLWDVARYTDSSGDGDVAMEKAGVEHVTSGVSIFARELPNGATVDLRRPANLPGGNDVVETVEADDFKEALGEVERFAAMFEREGTWLIDGEPVLQ